MPCEKFLYYKSIEIVVSAAGSRFISEESELP